MFPVLPLGESFEFAFLEPVADVTVGGAGVEAEGGGEFLVGLRSNCSGRASRYCCFMSASVALSGQQLREV